MRTFSRKKKIAFSAVFLILALFAVELALHLLYLASHRQMFPFREHQEAILELSASRNKHPEDQENVDGGMNWTPHDTEVIHPFLGFVKDPKRTSRSSYLGFTDKQDDPLAPAGENEISVAIFGGSFAEGVANHAEEKLESLLLESGIKARIITVAMGGYKQPQHLMALAYLLSHDAHIDVVVNIDGFNEVTLPTTDNLSKGVNPFYPRDWYTRTAGLADHETMERIGRISVLRDERRQWAKKFQALPRYSIVRNITWRGRDRQLEDAIEDLDKDVRKSRPRKRKEFLRRGPDLGFNDGSAIYPAIARHWRDCSILMKSLCDARGILYLHFLQPNQYFDTGRSLTDEEKRIAFMEDHAYRQGVVEGYPLLREEAASLLAAGVRFNDLTSIYDGVGETLYIDTCCHTNREGYEIIAGVVSKQIIEGLN